LAADLLNEAAASIGRRPLRSSLTALGTVLGVGAFVATAGLTSTVRAQISDRFNALKATEVVVKEAAPDPDQDPVLPGEVESRLDRLNGVRAAGLSWVTVGVSSTVTARPFLVDASSVPVPVIAASPGVFAAAHATFVSGRGFDEFHRRRSERVAVLGVGAARRLGVRYDETMPSVFLNGTSFVVVGVIGSVDRAVDLLGAVIVPDLTVTRLYGARTGREQAQVLIDVQPGAAQLIGTQAALALAPQAPGRLQVIVPPEPQELRRSVEADSGALFYLLAAVSLAGGAVGIANTTLVAVLERRHEIGLRRAMGATRLHIAAQFVAESAVLGALAGLLGTVAGLLATIGASIVERWEPTMPVAILLAAPAIGAVTGLAAGVYPAWHASRTQPADALRTG
jgi:putative ABC transport system permease protein